MTGRRGVGCHVSRVIDIRGTTPWSLRGDSLMAARNVRQAILILGRTFCLAAILGLSSQATIAADDSRPNILWISAEDVGPQLGCYGDEYATSPNLDRLASQGAIFTRAFSHAGVCAVARSGIISGVYPVSIGSQHMRSRVAPPPEIKCFPEYLRAAGYWCTNRSKTDYNWDAPLTAWDENSPQSKDWRGREPGQPFFSVINLTVSHESKIRANYNKLDHDPADVVLPSYIPDTPAARRDRARYYDIYSEMDRQAGEILKRLEDDGLADDTVVFFWGDHGEGLPRGKRWIYDSGIRVPLIVRRPEHVQPGATRDDLVSFLDFAPTVLSLAGVKPQGYMHGRVFLGEHTAPPPEFLFAHRDRMDEAYDLIRAVRGKRFKYIRNFMPRRSYGQHIDYMDKMPTMIDMRRLHAEGKLKGPQKLYFRENKPVEELYDTTTDPDEVQNLASDPQHQKTLARMRTALEKWQVEIGDLGLIPESVLMAEMRPENLMSVAHKPLARFTPAQGGKAGEAQVRVSLSSPTEGASIAWTTEKGRKPHWNRYSEPFQLPAGTPFRAVTCRLGYRDSPQIELTARPMSER